MLFEEHLKDDLAEIKECARELRQRAEAPAQNQQLSEDDEEKQLSHQLKGIGSKISDTSERVEEVTERIRQLNYLAGDDSSKHEQDYATNSETSLEEEVKQAAFYLSTIIQDLDTEIEQALKLLNSRGNQHDGLKLAAATSGTSGKSQTAKGWLQSLKSVIQKMSSKLWKVIMNLITPKEWKIKGGLSTGVLGLAGAEVEVTFGP